MASEEQQRKVEYRLKLFTEYFVERFEAKLQFYLKLLEHTVDPLESTFHECVSSIVDAATGSPGPVAGLVTKKVVDLVKNTKFKQDTTKLLPILNEFKNDIGKTNIRKSLVEAAFDIFQSYEMQFMKFDAKHGGDLVAMGRLAETAVNNVIKFYTLEDIHQELNVELITKGITYDAENTARSYKKCITMMSNAGKSLKSEGNTKINTIKLFTKTGLVEETSTGKEYYKTRKTNTGKYGYRRLFTSEIKADDLEKETNQYKEYTYEYILQPGMITEKSKYLLQILKDSDPNLMEERLKEFIRDSFQENLSELLHTILDEIICKMVDSVQNKLTTNKEQNHVKQSLFQASTQTNIFFENNNIGAVHMQNKMD